MSDSDYSEADEVQAAPKRKTPAKRATRLATLFASGFNALQQGEEGEPAEEERTNRDAFWHGFGGTSKVHPPPGPLVWLWCCDLLCRPISGFLREPNGPPLMIVPTFQLGLFV